MATTTFIGIILVLILAISNIQNGKSEQVFDTRGESGLRWIIQRLAEKPHILQDIKNNLEVQLKSTFEIDNQEDSFDNSSGCFTCKIAVGVLQWVTSLGYKYKGDVIRPLATYICIMVMELDTPRTDGETMCPPLMDLYGPHVTYIVNQTNENGTTPQNVEKLCILMNHCESNFTSTIFAQASSKPTKANKENSKSAQPFFETENKLKRREDNLRHKPPITPFHLYNEESKDKYWGKKFSFVSKIMSSEAMIPAIIGRNHRAAKQKRHQRRKDDAIRIAQVTDFHVDLKYAEGTPIECDLPVCCRNDTNGNLTNGQAGKWGEISFCNIPPQTTELFLEFVRDLNPDFVIYSGDNPPHSTWEESQESQLDMVKWVAERVTSIITKPLNITAYPSIGNHETNPTNLYTMVDAVHGTNMTDFNKVWAESWTEAAGFQNDQMDTIHKAGYYSMPLRLKEGTHPIRLVAFNSNYGYADDYYNMIHKNRTEFIEMCDWFERTLSEARDNSEKVIILTHHDVGSFENIIEYDEWFTKILADYSDIVIFNPVGHTHRDEFRLYFNDEDHQTPAGVVHVGMTMNSWPQVNPGFRIYYLDKTDYTILDYDQYFIDLKKVPGGADKPVPKIMYTFTEEYDVPDASAKSYMILWQRMRYDRTVMKKYWDNRRLRSNADPNMSDEEWRSEVCHGISQSYGRYRDCFRTLDMTPTTPQPPTPTAGSAKLRAGLVMGFVSALLIMF